MWFCIEYHHLIRAPLPLRYSCAYPTSDINALEFKPRVQDRFHYEMQYAGVYVQRLYFEHVVRQMEFAFNMIGTNFCATSEAVSLLT